MASKRSGSKAKSRGGAKAGKGKASLKDLDAKGSKKIKGGSKERADLGYVNIMKVVDKTSP
jgi:hypothetical protein